MLVVASPVFANAAEGADSEFTMNFGIMRRLHGVCNEVLEGGNDSDAAKIMNSAGYTRRNFVLAVQALILDNLRTLSEGNGGIEYPEEVSAVEYMVGALSDKGELSNYVTIEVIDPMSYPEFRADIELDIQVELERGAVHGSDTQGLTRLFEVYFKSPETPPTVLKLG